MKRLLTGAVGLVLVVGLAGVSGSATAARPTDPPSRLLDRPMAGAAAVRALGDDLPIAAQRNRMSTAHLTRLLTQDPTTRLSPSGRVYYVDEGRASAAAADVAPPAYPLDQTFALHSLPGASRTIFLDFDGTSVSNTEWNTADFGSMPARQYQGWSLDTDHGSFSASERAFIQDVWARVSEDYAPFQIDVTTADPGIDALTRSTEADTTYGMRAAVTDDDEAWDIQCGRTCSGVAFIDVFDDWTGGPGFYQPAWIFGGDIDDDNQWMADVISHEVGHTLGLEHDGSLTGGEYYSGQGVWQPIMGNGSRPLSQFSDGDYLGASNHQDDFAVMQATGAPLRPDDHPDSAGSGTVLTTTASGVIGTRADVDWFRVAQGCTGPFSVSVRPAPVGPDLDVHLVLQDSAGTVIADVDPAPGHDTTGHLTGLDAAWSSASLPAGGYRLAIEGVGHGDPLLDGYSDYGSVGAYTVSTQTTCTLPGVPTSVRASRWASGRGVTLTWQPPADEGGSPVTGYEVRQVDGPTGTVGADVRTHGFSGLTPGTKYSFTVRAITASGKGPAVSRSVTTPRQPGAVTGVVLGDASPTSLLVRWAPPTTTGGSAITGYQVRRGSGSWVTLGSAARSYRFAGLLGATTYGVTVRAVNRVGVGPATVRSYRTDPPVRPWAPRIATASSGTTGGAVNAKARWSAPTSNGGAPITAYRVYALRMSPTGTVLWKTYRTVAASSRSYLFTLPKGAFRFQVVAMNKVGASKSSARSNLVAAR